MTPYPDYAELAQEGPHEFDPDRAARLNDIGQRPCQKCDFWDWEVRPQSWMHGGWDGSDHVL